MVHVLTAHHLQILSFVQAVLVGSSLALNVSNALLLKLLLHVDFARDFISKIVLACLAQRHLKAIVLSVINLITLIQWLI